MSTPPPLPTNPQPPPQADRPQPLPVLPIIEWRVQRPPYRITAAVSWILPTVCVVAWILIPRPANSPLNYKLTGAVRFGFLIGLIISVIALLGIIRRGGNKGPAIVGLIVNAFLMFAFP